MDGADLVDGIIESIIESRHAFCINQLSYVVPRRCLEAGLAGNLVVERSSQHLTNFGGADLCL
jgi:hypothetical protein